ncbi:Putative phosphatidate phosphatase [Eumeta japonica]|uniref:Phosphatidate phosphatase n=1 Tax=Eumeta variegata TaxID=151549 RepID=A0A4C1ULN8_EUMVA|nr:Putative phosphatidate phosphatase [Eumeta japonica]
MTRDAETLRMLGKVVVDAFIFVVLGIAVYFTRHLWQPFQRGFFCGDESLMYPYRDDTISTVVLHVVGASLPCVTIIVCEYIVLRNHKGDKYCLGIRIPAWAQGTYCTLVSFFLGLVYTELATNIAKNTIGRPRPHFFDYSGRASVAGSRSKALDARSEVKTFAGRYPSAVE